MQRQAGDNLLGEMIHTSAFIAAGAVLVFALVRRVASSGLSATAIAALTVLSAPRPYDFDKFFCYPLGILLCWPTSIARRRCTQPDDRIFATWFVPQLYFFSSRGFAGGMVVTFGGHWSEPDRQHRIVTKLKAEPVPLVVFQDDGSDFRVTYPIVDEYLRGNYRRAGSLASYVLFSRNDWTSACLA